MYNKNKKNNSATSNNSREEINVALVGPVGCGKSALLVKYITKRFIGEYDPFYEGCWSRIENVDGTESNVTVMDTYDKERKNLEKYLKWSDALVLVYSITSSQSFFAIQEYLERVHDLLRKMSEQSSESVGPSETKAPIKIILLGNKIDLERYRQVNKQDVEVIIEKYLNNTKAVDLSSSQSSETINLNLIHMESTSCDDYELLQNLFHKIIRDIRRDREIYSSTNLANTQTNDETNSNSNIVHNKQNSFKSRFNSSPAFIGSKRAKSPKSTSNLIQDNSNSHLSAPSSTHGSNNFISIQSNNNSVNNLSNTLNSINKDNNSNTAKKNKFPFFTKILNKS